MNEWMNEWIICYNANKLLTLAIKGKNREGDGKRGEGYGREGDRSVPQVPVSSPAFGPASGPVFGPVSTPVQCSYSIDMGRWLFDQFDLCSISVRFLFDFCVIVCALYVHRLHSTDCTAHYVTQQQTDHFIKTYKATIYNNVIIKW